MYFEFKFVVLFINGFFCGIELFLVFSYKECGCFRISYFYFNLVVGLLCKLCKNVEYVVFYLGR